VVSIVGVVVGVGGVLVGVTSGVVVGDMSGVVVEVSGVLVGVASVDVGVVISGVVVGVISGVVVDTVEDGVVTGVGVGAMRIVGFELEELPLPPDEYVLLFALADELVGGGLFEEFCVVGAGFVIEITGATTESAEIFSPSTILVACFTVS
jgi:hypothetical protein